MNKKYIKPASEAVLFTMESIAATSPGDPKLTHGEGGGDWNSRRRDLNDDFDDEWEDVEE